MSECSAASGAKSQWALRKPGRDRRQKAGRQNAACVAAELMRLDWKHALAVRVEMTAHTGWRPAATGNDGRCIFPVSCCDANASVRADIQPCPSSRSAFSDGVTRLPHARGRISRMLQRYGRKQGNGGTQGEAAATGAVADGPFLASSPIPGVFRLPGVFAVQRDRSEGLAMACSLCYEAPEHLPIQQVRGPVAQPDRATVS